MKKAILKAYIGKRIDKSSHRVNATSDCDCKDNDIFYSFQEKSKKKKNPS